MTKSSRQVMQNALGGRGGDGRGGDGRGGDGRGGDGRENVNQVHSANIFIQNGF